MAQLYPVRMPAAAGQFYPAEPDQCRQQARAYMERANLPVNAARDNVYGPHFSPPLVLRGRDRVGARPETAVGKPPPLPSPGVPGEGESAGRRWIGGLVPHAGWICSGAIAGQTLVAMSRGIAPDLVVVFGAVHTPIALRGAALDVHRVWELPTGKAEIPEELQRKLIEQSADFCTDERFHSREHAVEVEVPLIQQAWPAAAILPVEVAADDLAVEIGRQTAQRVQTLGIDAVFLASSDLTHYGPDYRFTPAGVGLPAIQWGMQNDRRLLDAIAELADGKIVPEAITRQNACGGGAIAAMLAACKEFGATTAQLLSHTNSFEVLRNVAPQPPVNAVGYASVVVG